MNLQDQAQSNEGLRRLTLINSVIGVSIAGISTRVFMISVPTLATALGTDMLGISWALIVYQMAGIGLGVICGRLGDIYGHHKMYGFGMGIMALGSLLCGFSQDVVQLILFRFVQGVGGAMIQSSGRTLAFRAMPQGSEGKAQGLMAMSHQFGFFVGPPIGGLIIDWIHWRGIFFFLFVPSLVGMALCFMTGRSVAPPTARHQTIDYRGALLFFALSILATLLLDQKIAEILGGASQTMLVLAFVGAVWGFVSHEKKTPSPMIDLSFFSVLAYGYGSVGLLLCCITQGLVMFVAPFYLQDVLKLSPTFIGIIFIVPSLLSMVLSPVSGALTDRIGARFVDLGHAHPDGGFFDRRQPAHGHALDLARRPARAHGRWFGVFQYALPSGDDWLTAQRTLGHGHRHHQRDLRPGTHARHFAKRHFSDLGVSLLFRNSGNHAQSGRHAGFRRVDERNISLRAGHQYHPIVDLFEDEERRVSGKASHRGIPKDIGSVNYAVNEPIRKTG